MPFLHYMCALSHCLCYASFPSRATSLSFARIRTRSEKSSGNDMSWYRISASLSAYEFTNGCGASSQHLKTFESIMNDPNHKLRKLLPPSSKTFVFIHRLEYSKTAFSKISTLKSIFEKMHFWWPFSPVWTKLEGKILVFKQKRICVTVEGAQSFDAANQLET